MKCPKCGYVGFESADRCRHCGYDFSFSGPAGDLQLPIHATAPATAALGDFPLGDGGRDAASGGSAERDFRLDLDRVLGATAPALPGAGDLPLFARPIADDEPLITRPSPPRPPLAVRRATPEVPRLRPEQPRMPALELAFEAGPGIRETAAGAPRPAVSRGADREAAARHAEGAAAAEDAGLGIRLVAGAIDFLVLTVIDAIVLYFTLEICGVPIAEVAIVPKGPLGAFLLLLNGGYLLAFTLGGQSLGKMAAGIRVVSERSGVPVDVGHATLRTLIWMVLAMPAGLGFLTTVFSRDRRGLHDRFAGTRVIRASAA